MTEDLKNTLICDMGIAKLKHSVHDPTTSTHLIRAYPYMAPEFFEGGSCTAVDIYSLGSLLIELFGERIVWPGLHTSAAIYDSPPTMLKK